MRQFLPAVAFGIFALTAQAGILSRMPASTPFPVAEGSVPNDASQPKADAKTRKLGEEIKALKAKTTELVAQTQNSRGVLVSAHGRPSDVLRVVEDTEKLVSKFESTELKNSTLLRSIYLDALHILYRGRGKTDDAAGWYLANRSGDTGIPEIKKIVGKGVLDEKGKEDFKRFVSELDFDSPQVKTASGFPPAFQIGTPQARDEVLSLLAQAKTVKQPYVNVSLYKLKTVEELIAEAAADAETKKVLRGFLGAVENNLHDRSVKTLNDPGKDFINYFGRDEEVEQISQSLSKTEKGHVLATGKAGVGKTTGMQKFQDACVQGKIRIRGEADPPIVLELSIVDVTNPTDPSLIKTRIAQAKLLSSVLKRRVVLYVDEAHISSEMTRNAIKNFLTEKLVEGGNMVHLVFSTTTGEARDFLKDSALSRRFTEVFFREFTNEESIQLIKTSYVPFWQVNLQGEGVSFKDIAEEAYQFAAKNAELEQRHAGNPTGIKELLEASIVRKLRVMEKEGKTGPLNLTLEDIRDYLKTRAGTPLVAGDPDFDAEFERRWNAFEKEYAGNEGFKHEFKKDLRRFFAQSQKRQMYAAVLFGPPGGGKTYGAEQIAKHFFNGAVLEINGADYKEGGLGLNKLIGSPPGTVGSEEQRSVLTRFMSDHPYGGIIKIEEADYLHQDVVQLFTNMITSKKFTDGLGKEWKTDRYVIIQNSNIGQELMIPVDSRNRMTWEQYETRRKQLTQTIKAGDREIEIVKPEKIKPIFDQFIRTIVEKSHPGEDTGAVSQEANKQRRRYKAYYVLNPNKKELLAAARAQIGTFVSNARADFNVSFDLSKITGSTEKLEKLLHIERYEFEKGYSYIEEQLENKLFDYLDPHVSERGKSVSVDVVPARVDVSGEEMPGMELVVTKDGKEIRHPIEIKTGGPENPWAQNPELRARIKNFTSESRKYLRGNARQIEEIKEQLKLKLLDWNTRVVITQIGTSGNGKTESGKVVAKVVFDDSDAFYKISGITDKYKLANYFRPPTGIQGGMEETEFERWLKSRLHSGGGVICFDELLSFHGLNEAEISHKLEAINELYDLLDEGFLRVGNKLHDVRGFVIWITGNALQEAFQGVGDDPGSEYLIEQITAKLTRNEIVKYFMQYGIDPPKLARFGKIFVNGPLPRSETLEVGRILIGKTITEIQSVLGRKIEVVVPEAIIGKVVSSLTTVVLGMREVGEGFNTLIKQPASGILADIPGVKKLEAKLDGETVLWFADGKEVVLEGVKLDVSGIEERNWVYKSDVAKGASIRTPRISDLNLPGKTIYTEESFRMIAIHEIYGHWMTGVLVSGVNGAEAISLIPGDGYGGYVRKRFAELAELDTLTSMMKQVIELEAGHRAVFLVGKIYAAGGGPESAEGLKGRRADDIGKVKTILEKTLHNQLLQGYSELSSPAEQKLFMTAMKELGVLAADRVIEKGIESGQFDEVFKRGVAERYLNGEQLDDFVRKLDVQKLGASDKIFHDALSDAALETLKRSPKETFAAKKALIGDFMERAYTELRAKSGGPKGAGTHLEAAHKKFKDEFEKLVAPTACGELLHKNPGE